MTLRNLYALLALLLVLAAVFYVSKSDFESVSTESSNSKVRLLENRNGEQAATLLIEQGADLLEIKKSENQWVVASKDSYPADAGKVGGLLLKLFDLQTSQRVPTGPKSAEKLGLAPSSVKNEGYTKISLLSEKGDILGGLRLGKLRQKKKESGSGAGMGFSAAGQYVRRLDDEQVYVIGLPINVSAKASEWVQTSILNAPSANVMHIAHSIIDGEQEKLVFSLSRDSSADDLTLDGDVPAGEEVQSSVISQLGSALENLRLIDVSRAEGDFRADRRSVYKLNNGAVYTVETKGKGDNALGRIRVIKDPSWVALLKETTAQESNDSSGSEEADGSAPSGTESSTDAAGVFAEVREEEIEAQNARFNPWIFEFPSYQAMKFRRDREDLFKKKDKSVSQ